MRARRLTAALASGAVLVGLAACGSDDSSGPSASPSSTGDSVQGGGTATPEGGGGDVKEQYAAAVSEPVEDSVYPDIGEPDVDALHYALSLQWDPGSKTLTGDEELTFRSTADGDHVQLDLEPQLEVSAVQVDGADAEFEHTAKNLAVSGDFAADQQYVMTIAYSGRPAPVEAPTTRSDFSTTGFTVTDDGSAWTMQEPYGAYSWYAVNDQPADKAFYDFTLTAPEPMRGVANGMLTGVEQVDGSSVSTFHLDSTTSSYLVTVAFGNYRKLDAPSVNGVPITYWYPKGTPKKYVQSLKYTPKALEWVESKLGDYPWSSLGMLLVDSNSGMETQTLITLGDTDYTTQKDTIVHEIVHQWYGDRVTPDDWRDLWMNEGMAMYLQFVWQSETSGVPIETILRQAAAYERQSRAVNGPPAAYDPKTFGEIQVYYGPALMWDQIRRRVGDDTFWAMVKAWPESDADGTVSRDEYLPWIEKQTGADLHDLFDGWLLAKASPAFS
ncbi:MAG: M1 family metallopeptidase [Nocardioides sp.]